MTYDVIGKEAAGRMIKITPLTVYGMLELDSYMADLENSLSALGDDDYSDFRKDPEPYVIDMLSDFGSVPDLGLSDDAALAFIKIAARCHVRSRTAEFYPDVVTVR